MKTSQILSVVYGNLALSYIDESVLDSTAKDAYEKCLVDGECLNLNKIVKLIELANKNAIDNTFTDNALSDIVGSQLLSNYENEVNFDDLRYNIHVALNCIIMNKVVKLHAAKGAIDEDRFLFNVAIAKE